MPSIFISYRRDDSADVTGRIYENLVAKFGSESVFKDVHSIRAGDSVNMSIAQAVRQCEALLAVIGPSWLSLDSEGQKRIDAVDDFVRLEIESVLNTKQ